MSSGSPKETPVQQQFATFKEACDYKVDDKQHECGDGKFFVSEERFIDAASNWGTASTTRTPSSSSAAPATPGCYCARG